MQRRTLLAALPFAMTGAAGVVRAQDYPTRPLRLVVPWPPGQATDLGGRVLANHLTGLLKQPVVVDNRGGAGGVIGTDAVAKAAPDGYTLLAASAGPVSIVPLLQKVPYDPDRELMAVAMIGMSPYVLSVGPSFPARDLKEFIAAVRAMPGHYTFSSSGTGATAHLIGEMFNHAAGLQALHVPFTGSAPSLTALVSGQVDYTLETLAGSNPLLRSNALRALGISFKTGSTLAPEIPSIARAADLPNFDVGAWLGIMVPAGTPRAIVTRAESAVRQSMEDANTREQFASIGVEVIWRAADDFASYLQTQRTAFGNIIRTANIRVE
jgi:tripartite-type tricarboxylate transporter receptor subunit TctC